MAWTAPPQHLRRNKDLLDDKEFYRKLSVKWNYIDEETAAFFYLGFVKLIANELKQHKFVRLPHLTDIALVEQKSRPAWVGKAHVRIAPRDVLKFYPKEKMRRYFNKRQGDPVLLAH